MNTTTARKEWAGIIEDMEGAVALASRIGSRIYQFEQQGGPKALGYKDIDELSKKTLGVGRAQFFRLRKSGQIAGEIEPALREAGVTKPVSEWALRPLGKLGPDDRIRVVARAAQLADEDSDEEITITEKHIKAAIEDENISTSASRRPATQDDGYEGSGAENADISPGQRAVNRAGEFSAILETLRGVRRTVDNLMADPAVGYFFHDETKNMITRAGQMVLDAHPYKVCPKCSGTGCEVCGGTGYMPRKTYEAALKAHLIQT